MAAKRQNLALSGYFNPVDLALAAAVDDMISQGKPDFMVLTATCTALAFMAQKDMSWKQALASARRGEIITAL